MLWCIGCNNHKLALGFKHLIAQFPTNLKAFLLSLWKFFKYHPLAKNFLEENATKYDQDPITAVCPVKPVAHQMTEFGRHFTKAISSF